MKTKKTNTGTNTGIGVLIFGLGIIAGLLSNLAARKVNNMKILPDGWFEEGEWLD